ncbi:MAG: hypothetical protein JXA73_12005 [Acidobacteria bacterium]|nr:hypothetical protein [Acidobacteriota bacterium]
MVEIVTKEQSNVVNHGYTNVDRLLECVSNITGKIAVRAPWIRYIKIDRYPKTREELISVLKEKDLRLYETADWAYIIDEDHFKSKPTIFPGGRVPEWRCIQIVPRINPEKRGNFTEEEQKMIAKEVFRQTRMIPLWTSDTSDDDRRYNTEELRLEFDLFFSRVKLHPDAPESIMLLMQQVIEQVPDYGSSIGRQIRGEMRDGKFIVLWDSCLFTAHGRNYYLDVNGDGWEEIVFEGETGGNVSYPIWTIFDKDGREISRQRKCDNSTLPFKEEDGACPITGIDISFSSPMEEGPKDIRVLGWDYREDTTIFKLQNGMYVPQLPQPAPKRAKQKPKKSSNPSSK